MIKNEASMIPISKINLIYIYGVDILVKTKNRAN